MKERPLKVYKCRILTNDAAHNQTAMVRARNEKEAIAYVIRKHLEVTVATPDDLVSHGMAGLHIDDGATQ